jgi:hypothetical protein
MSVPAGQSFTQHVLSDEQLRAGVLAPVDNVRIPDEPIAMTALRAGELGKMSGIAFQESYDDLDSGYFAVLEFTEGFSVTLKDYAHSPVTGVRIYTDREGMRSRARLATILDALGLSRDDLIWIVPELE